MERVLLVEPDYKNKFPPLGLMKLSTFHQNRGDYVRFTKGQSAEIRALHWDRIYVTTLFTFEWKRTVETIRFYSRAESKPKVFVGGIMASLLTSELEAEVSAQVIPGLLNDAGLLGYPGEGPIDGLVPDYSLLDDADYVYPVMDSYFAHATRGCIRHCGFCAVPTIEPKYQSYLPLRKQVQAIEDLYGTKRDLVLMDNNTLASPHFEKIVEDIEALGFGRGARLGNKARYVDFNQGLDARLVTRENMALLGRLNVRPVRLAFDSLDMRAEYEQAVRWAADEGFTRLSNYVLWNCEDTPQDLYERLRINIDLNEELGTQIFSFPMRFSPVERRDRKYIGPRWTWRHIRGVQCILTATRGVVGIGRKFFLRAFGSDAGEFMELITMPEPYIMDRDVHERTDAAEWRSVYRQLNPDQKAEFHALVLGGRHPVGSSDDALVRTLLAHY